MGADSPLQIERLSDREFDRLYPAELRGLSAVHWTPVAVARRAAEWLAPYAGARVLDVGSGAGKFCFVGALATQGEFTGVERRRELVELARAVARASRVPRRTFQLGDATEFSWEAFDGGYLVNPFCEVLHPERAINLDIPAGNAAYARAVRATREKLATLRVGARVALYHGFGGRLPKGFRRLARETFDAGQLEVYERVQSTTDGGSPRRS